MPDNVTSFNQETFDAICERLALGESLRSICKNRENGMPEESTVRKWIRDDVAGCYPQYVRAREMGLDSMADETLDISDDDGQEVNHRRLRVDTRKWYLSKLAPKRYGDSARMELSGQGGGPVQISETARTAKLAALLAALASNVKSENDE